jgi:ABC-type microcin C transport system permease subunit YejE
MTVHVEYDRVAWLAGQVEAATESLLDGRAALVDTPYLSNADFGGEAECAHDYRGLETKGLAAARVLGVPTRRILFRELLPNLIAPIVISASLALPGYVVAEAGLTLLGVGLTEPTPSWGLTIASAQNFYRAEPLYLWLPFVGITVLVLALSLLGDAIRDSFDPRTRL